MAHLGGLYLPSLQSRSHDISSIYPSQKWSSSGGKVKYAHLRSGLVLGVRSNMPISEVV